MTVDGRLDLLHLLDPPADGWRSLLLVGVDDASTAAVREAQVADVVRTATVAEVLAGASASAASPADACLVVAPLERSRCRALLAGVHAHLGPDAVVGVVVTGARPGTGRLISTSRHVRQAGFAVHGRWWAVPGFPAPRRFVPLDAPAALRWWATTMLAGLARRRLSDAAGVVPGVPQLLTGGARLLAAEGVVVAGAGAGAGPSAARLVTTSGNDRLSRTVVASFGRRPIPDRIDKVATRPAGAAVVHAEQARMASVRTALPAEAASSIPVPLGTRRIGGLVAGLETGMPGRSLAVLAPADPTGETLASAAGWLRHLACDGDARWDEARWRRWVDEPARSVQAAHADAARQLADSVAPLADGSQPAPLAIRHHDYGPWNLLWSRKGLAVLDWEWGAEPPDPVGPALADLVYLATYWVHAAGGHDTAEVQTEVLAELWCEPIPTRREVRTARAVVRRELAATGVASVVVPLLVAHTWLDQAATVTDRLALAGTARGDRPHPLLAVDVLAERADELLATWA